MVKLSKQLAKVKPAPKAVMVTAKEPKETHTEITCIECGSIRTVAVQDIFQVKRCQACQKQYRQGKRREARKLRVARLQERIAELESQLGQK